jgi:hypothetical protein
MHTDIDLESILMNDSVGYVIGVPHTKEIMTGVVDGTNKDFLTAAYPIYPRSGLSIVPTISDIDVFGRKTTVDTPLVASALKTVTDPGTGDSVEGGATLATAPAAESADSIVSNYYEELEPFVAQSIAPTVKQDSKTIKRLRSTNVMYAYGSIEVSLKSEEILSKNGLKQLPKLCYEEYTPTSGTVATGYKAYKMVSNPINLKSYITFEYDDDTLGRIYMDKCQMTPDIPDGKQGDTSKFNINMSVQGDIMMLLPSEV